MGFSWTRLGTWAVAFVIGAVYGVAGTIGQAAAWGPLPVGIVIAIVGTGALLLAMRLLTADRWAALACAFGVMLATLVFSGKGPSGSIVVPQPPEGEISTGVVWTIAVPIVAAIVIGWPALTRPGARPAGDTTN